SDHVRAARLDRVERRVGPATAGLVADLLDELTLLETLDQLGCRDLGESSQLTEPGPGQRTLVEQQLESGPVVDGAQQAGRAGLPGLSHARALALETLHLGKFPIRFGHRTEVASLRSRLSPTRSRRDSS